MDDKTLREMDVKVQHALYPEHRVELRERRDPYYLVIVPDPASPGAWMASNILPHYTTDIGAWESVYALKPGWLWSINELVECVWVTLRVMGRPYDVVYSTVATTEATGLAAYALGRARCVIAWAEEKR